MKLRILHISDLHFTHGERVGDDWPVEEFNRDMVTSSMVEFLKTLFEKENKPDLIIITGDMAYGGKEDEYRVAEVFCERLLNACSIGKERLYIVPGNHDVDRKEVTEARRRTLYCIKSQETISGILGDPALLPALMKKFSDFNASAKRIMGRHLFSESDYYFSDNLILEKDRYKATINLLGLNSALFAGYYGDDQQKLAFGLRQVDGAIRKMSGEAVISIGLFHHPFKCFHQCDQVCHNRLKEKLDVILTGHLHEPHNAAIHDEAGKVVIVGAGTCYERRETDENAFNLVELDLSTGSGWVEFYKYLHNRHRWTKNHDVNLDADDRPAIPATAERQHGWRV